MESINELYSNREALAPVFRQNLSQMLVDTTDERAKAIQAELAIVQKKLIDNPGMEAELGERILELRKESEALHAEYARSEATRTKVEGFMKLLDGMRLTEYSDDLVRTFISSIKVHSDRFTIRFRSGVEVEVD